MENKLRDWLLTSLSQPSFGATKGGPGEDDLFPISSLLITTFKQKIEHLES